MRDGEQSEQSDAVVSHEHRPRLGPHRVPRIECERCGEMHHIDAAAGEYLGHCSECNGFLRRPTEAEERQFAAFIEWNYLHWEADR